MSTRARGSSAPPRSPERPGTKLRPAKACQHTRLGQRRRFLLGLQTSLARGTSFPEVGQHPDEKEEQGTVPDAVCRRGDPSRTVRCLSDMFSEALVSGCMPAASHSHTLSAASASLRERRSSAEGSMRGSSGHSRRTVSAAAAIGRAAVGCAQLNSTIVAQGEPRGGGRELSTCNES